MAGCLARLRMRSGVIGMSIWCGPTTSTMALIRQGARPACGTKAWRKVLTKPEDGPVAKGPRLLQVRITDLKISR